MRQTAEEWLPSWGFAEIKREPSQEKIQVMAFYMRLLEATVFHLVDETGFRFTVIYDPDTARSWFREGHAMRLDHGPFNLRGRPITHVECSYREFWPYPTLQELKEEKERRDP